MDERLDASRTVVAAIDNSMAARPVLMVARALAGMVAAQVEAVHVPEDGDPIARAGAVDAGVAYVRLRRDGDVERLYERASRDDVVAVVVGVRSVPAATGPAGHVALQLITRLAVPVVVVPPMLAVGRSFRRMLVPLDGTRETAEAMSAAIDFALDADMDVIALHVHDRSRLPMFTDQPQHEWRSWSNGFLRRFTSHPHRVRLELRIGDPAEHLLAVAEQQGADMLALGWSQRLEAGRAAVVREAIERGRVPVMLIPLASTPDTASPLAAPSAPPTQKT